MDHLVDKEMGGGHTSRVEVNGSMPKWRLVICDVPQVLLMCVFIMGE